MCLSHGGVPSALRDGHARVAKHACGYHEARRVAQLVVAESARSEGGRRARHRVAAARLGEVQRPGYSGPRDVARTLVVTTATGVRRKTRPKPIN